MNKLDKGRTVTEQVVLQEMVESMEIGFRTAIRDQEIRKEEYDKILTSAYYEETKYYIIELNNLPSLMCAGCIYPSFDFQGNRLQNLANLKNVLESISLSVIANNENRGFVVFAWLGNDDGPCDRLVKSYHYLTNYQKAQSIVRFVFEYFENKYLNIYWWNSLNENIRNALYERQEKAVNGFEERGSDCLIDDSIHYVDWEVKDFHSSVEFI